MKLLRILNTKVLPLILSAAILINVQIPLYAQQNPYAKQYTAVKDNTNVVNRKLELAITKAVTAPKLPYTLTFEEVSKAAAKAAKGNNLSQEDYSAIYNQYLTSLKNQDIQVAYVTALLRKEYNPEGLISYYQKKASKDGTACEGKLCYPVEVWMHGILRVIIYQATGQNTNDKQFKDNKEIMLTAVPHIYSIVAHYGLNRHDAYSLQKYLRFVLEDADKYCDNDTYMYDIAPGYAGGNGKADARQGKERRQRECEGIGKAMITLAMISPFEQDKNQNAQIIYDTVKDTYSDDYGAITLSTGINALMAVDNAKAYEFTEKLLTKDTLPTGSTFKAVKNFGGQLLDLLSISSWADKGIEAVNLSRGGGGRYLNNYNQTLQYIDEDYSRASGMSDFSLSVAKSSPSLGYNVSYRNVLEDIGIALGSTQNPAALTLSKKIIAQYIALEARRPLCLKAANYSPLAFETCSPSKNVHMPLVTGILQSAPIADSTAAKLINTLDWWDLNEGTQRRINNTVTDKYSGTVKRTLNEAKKKRNDSNQKIANASLWADILVSAIFVGALVKNIPSMARGISNAARTMRATVSGKGNLLKIVRANIKAGGVKPADIKMARQIKQAQAAEITKSESLLKQRGIKKDVYGNALKTSDAPAAAAPKAANATAPKNGNVSIQVIDNKGAATDIAASYSKGGKVKLEFNPANTNAPKAEGTLQESKNLFEQKNFFNNLTAQVGEGSGGGSGAISGGSFSPVIKPISAQPAPTAATQAFKPVQTGFTTPAENKIISAERLKKAAFSANINYYKNIASQFMRSLRTKTGAVTMAVNLSLTNPAMLNAASSGKIMPIIETISSYERAAAATSSAIRGAKTIAGDIKLYTSVLINTESKKILTVASFKKSLPVKSSYTRSFNLLGTSKYVLSSYLWLSALSLPPASAASKPVIYTKEEVIPLKREYSQESKPARASMGYQSLASSSAQRIDAALLNGEVISDRTISQLAEAFSTTHAKEDISILSATDNIRKLEMIAPVISKSLFDRMLSFIISPNAQKNAEALLSNNNKKALDKLIAYRVKNNKIFDNFFEAIMLKKNNNPNHFFTLNNQKAFPRENFDPDIVLEHDDLLPSLINNFFQTSSFKNILIAKTANMLFQEKDALMARILSLTDEIAVLKSNNNSKTPIKPVLLGNKYQWEKFDVFRPENIVISIEQDKGDISLEIAKWIEKRNIPNSGTDYLKHLPAWIADQLKLTPENPGIFARDEQGVGYFIYNNQGTTRVRFSKHEMNPAKPHIHIERITKNAAWQGLLNESYHSGPANEVKSNAERARSLFEQDIPKTESQINNQALDVGEAFMPIAEYFGSDKAKKAAADISNTANKKQAVKDLFKILEEASLNKYFMKHLQELQAQGLVK